MDLEYPCPTCGHDGPHPVLTVTDEGVTVVECIELCGEFEIQPAERDDETRDLIRRAHAADEDPVDIAASLADIKRRAGQQ